MSGENLTSTETLAQEVSRLFKELAQAGVNASNARNALKEILDSSNSTIIGDINPEMPLTRDRRARHLGGLIIARAEADERIKEVRDSHLNRLKELLIPNAGSRPILKITNLAIGAVAGEHPENENMYTKPLPVSESIVGTALYVTENWTGIQSPEGKKYRVSPTAFSSGEFQVSIEVLDVEQENQIQAA